jgi:hypothetical protein
MDRDIQMFPSNYLEMVGKTNADNVFKFLIVFSRFECALKATLKFSTKDIPVKPDWDKFIKAIRINFEKSDMNPIQEAMDFLLSNPPKIQVYNSEENKIDWRDNHKVETTKPRLCKLIDHIRAIRNNLFHGGKFEGINYNPNGAKEISRDYELISKSILILEFLLEFDHDVKNAYSAKIL